LNWFRRQHCINEVGQLGGNLTARDAQRFAVPNGNRWFMIFSRVEGRRRSSQILGVDQAQSEDVGRYS
jgi:hypothetical protein